MSNENTSLKHAAQIAVTALGILLLGAVVFYKERIFFIDAPHIFFRVLNNHSLVLEMDRYGSFVTQMIPLIGSWFHVPFKLMLIAYSVSFNLFYFVVSVVLVYRYKQYALAILMALYYTLFVSDTYFWTNNEVHQGTAWLFLFFAIALDMAKRNVRLWVQAPVFAGLCFLAVFTHPLIMVSGLFLWVYFLLEQKEWHYNKWQTILYTFIFGAIIYYRYTQSAHHGYDGAKMENVLHIKSWKDVVGSFNTPMLYSFLKDCVTNYWSAMLLFVAGMAVLLRQKKYLLAVYVTVSIMAFIILMSHAFMGAYDRHLLFYMESEWMTLSLIIALPFVFYVLPLLKAKQAQWLLIVVFLIRLSYIGIAAPLFHKRVVFIQETINGMNRKGLDKIILVQKDSRMDDQLLMSWGLPAETMLASRLNGETPQRTLILIPENDLQKNNVGKDTMLSCFQKLGLSQINHDYFTFDTTHPYTILTYEQLYQP